MATRVLEDDVEFCVTDSEIAAAAGEGISSGEGDGVAWLLGVGGAGTLASVGAGGAET